METLKIYKNIEVTFQEFERAILRFGYQKSLKNDVIIYSNDAFDSKIFVSNLVKPSMKMLRADFAANAFLMEMKGVLENRNDIAKMIEQDRLDAQARNTNTNQGISS